MYNSTAKFPTAIPQHLAPSSDADLIPLGNKALSLQLKTENHI